MTAEVYLFPGMTKQLETYPNRIRELRLAAGLTQQQLGDKVGMTAVNIGHLELGRRDASMKALQAIARELHVATAALLSAEDNPLNATPEGRQLAIDWEAAGDEGRHAIARVAESFTRYRPERSQPRLVEDMDRDDDGEVSPNAA
tara:strand:+ start:1183 stop:1617 length:435 start_codon:yes stop_codon:yes gene_type:complete